MILSLGLSSRGAWVRYFMQSWFPLISTPLSPALCHVCLLCRFQSYLVTGSPSGSLSHPPPPGPRCPFLGLQCYWGECNHIIGRPRVHRAFSISELLHGWGYKLFAWSCNPLQCSCLENPRDGGALWAAIYGVAQSWTRLKRLSSSSSSIPFWEPRESNLVSLQSKKHLQTFQIRFEKFIFVEICEYIIYMCIYTQCLLTLPHVHPAFKWESA